MRNNTSISRQKKKLTRGKGKLDQLVSKGQVMRMIHSNMDKVEMKYLNSAVFNAYIPPVIGGLASATFPSQGVTNGQREADSLAIKAIQVRCLMINIADITTSSNASDGIRLVCVQARTSVVPTLSYSAAPATGIFDLGSSGAVDITSHINLNAKDETFHVLHDETYPVCFLSSSALRLTHFILEPKVAKVNFTPTTTTSLMGGIYWVAISWQAGTTSISLEQRLIYHDL
jgi:hypothetical protein